MDRRTGSGRQRTITTKKNENLIENSICLQEDNPEEDNSYMSPKEVEKNTDISRTYWIWRQRDEFMYARNMNEKSRSIDG